MKVRMNDFIDLGQRLLVLLVVGYAAATVAKSIYRNYQLKQQIAAAKRQAVDLSAKIERQNFLNIYYQSPTYKELEARRRLGLKWLDEQVYILPEQKPGADTIYEVKGQKINQPAALQESNPRKWLEFLLGI